MLAASDDSSRSSVEQEAGPCSGSSVTVERDADAWGECDDSVDDEAVLSMCDALLPCDA